MSVRLGPMGAYVRCGGSQHPCSASRDRAPWAAAGAGLPTPDRGLSALPPFLCFLLSLRLSGPGLHGAASGGSAAGHLVRPLIHRGWGGSVPTLPSKTHRGNKNSGMGFPRREHAVTQRAVGHVHSEPRAAPGVPGKPQLHDSQQWGSPSQAPALLLTPQSGTRELMNRDLLQAVGSDQKSRIPLLVSLVAVVA